MDDRTASELLLLTTRQMYQADRRAVDAGVPSERLMERAGGAVVRALEARWSPRPTVVLCGPGNNGGDGFVVARRLAEHGWPVRVALLGGRDKLAGDAALEAKRWEGTVDPLDDGVVGDAALVVDALFGAGLARPLEGRVRAVVERLAGRDVVAVDVPSGVDGDTGAVRGAAPHAALTVTFGRRKPGHLLLPGRAHCGETLTADIGLPEEAVEAAAGVAAEGSAAWLSENGPGLWRQELPVPQPNDHKYSRGHVVVVGGGTVTGAGRLAARGAMRAGAGMVSVACPEAAASLYALDLPGALIRPYRRTDELRPLLEDRRSAGFLVGPGAGVTMETRTIAGMVLATRKPVVLDADALSVFEGDADDLARAIRGPCVVTPHEGEFARLFDPKGAKTERAAEAARHLGAVVVLKGYDTVIAAPDGRVRINASAPAWLATAGAGDVLAGMVLSLIGQGMDAMDAASAAVWIHGVAAADQAPGLIAEDLPALIRPVLAALQRRMPANRTTRAR